MRLNADFSQPVLVHAACLDWQPSPSAGVERRMLMRIGAEQAVATSLVRFAPGSCFPLHRHPGGEEFLVLEGCFVDGSGRYPAGSYVRNPPGSCHAPSAPQGCTILVQLWQFRRDDQQAIALLPDDSYPTPSPLPGQRLLFASADEQVFIADWPAASQQSLCNHRGLQLLVLAGDCQWGSATLQPLSWLRLPAGHDLDVRSGPHGCRLWIKLGDPVLPEPLAG